MPWASRKSPDVRPSRCSSVTCAIAGCCSSSTTASNVAPGRARVGGRHSRRLLAHARARDQPRAARHRRRGRVFATRPGDSRRGPRRRRRAHGRRIGATVRRPCARLAIRLHADGRERARHRGDLAGGWTEFRSRSSWPRRACGMLGVAQIRARLGDRFKLLARPGDGGASRQHTVLATIQWSWDHLLPPEQDLMRRARGVRRRLGRLDRATAVVSDQGDEFEVLDLLTSSRRALARRRRAPRLDSHAPIASSRACFSSYARGSRRIRTTCSCGNATWDEYVTLAKAAARAMAGPGAMQQIAELKPEEENVLAALTWCDHAPDGARRGLVLAESMARFWSILGRQTLGRRVLEEVIQRDAGNPPNAERARGPHARRRLCAHDWRRGVGARPPRDRSGVLEIEWRLVGAAGDRGRTGRGGHISKAIRGRALVGGRESGALRAARADARNCDGATQHRHDRARARAPRPRTRPPRARPEPVP